MTRASLIFTQKLMRYMSGLEVATGLPLDIQATAFQRRVWTYLQSIGFGETRSYSDVAKAIRRPSAVRAVAHACVQSVTSPFHAIAWCVPMETSRVIAGE
jgi:O-6-methylguanine DNA methyltransferase